MSLTKEAEDRLAGLNRNGVDLNKVVKTLTAAGLGASAIAKMMEGAGFKLEVAQTAGLTAAFVSQGQRMAPQVPQVAAEPPSQVVDAAFAALKRRASQVIARVENSTASRLGDVLDARGNLIVSAVELAEKEL